MLRRYGRAGELNTERGREALDDLAALAMTYDATYLSLAEALGATVVTRDSRLLNAPGHEARVEVV